MIYFFLTKLYTHIVRIFKLSNEFVNFHSLTDTSRSSYKNRIGTLDKYNSFLDANIIKRSKFPSVSDLSKFLRLKAKDANNVDVIKSSKVAAPVNGSDLDDDETKVVSNMIQNIQAAEFVQLFMDSYMAPLNSDIKWRLGDVTGTKIFNCDYENGTVMYTDKNAILPLAQYDEYGRIDTTTNLRLEIPIIGNGSCIQPTKEHVVNFFFPPYKNTAFAGYKSTAFADEEIKSRKWVEAVYDEKNKLKACTCGKKGGHWHYKDMSFDPAQVTYDTDKLLSLRENPTYRKVAYKALNDNISLLQHAFEYSTGIVSTYLTDWDISLYIQEGLLTDNGGTKPSVLSICNRIMSDNPSGYTDSDAYTYGVLNASVSKLDINTSVVPCKCDWDPSVYPLSIYWWPYDTVKGNSGNDSVKLPTFYDTAKLPFNKVNINTRDTRSKIQYYDELGAAYSGWLNWYDMKYYSSIYTTFDDGLSNVDIVHMCELTTNFFLCDTSDGSATVDGEITRIIDALLEDEEGLKIDYDSGDDDETGEVASEVSTDSDGSSKFKRKYRQRKSISESNLAVAKKSSSNFSNSLIGTSPSSPNGEVGVLNDDDSVNGQYSRQDGVSQWAPAIYGGPHGKFYSPKTVKAWNEVDNPFLRDVPRARKVVANAKSYYKSDHFRDNESFYTPTLGKQNFEFADPTRSPSDALSLLNHGSLAYNQQLVKVLNTYTVYMTKQAVRKKGWWIFYWYDYTLPETYNGYKLTYTGNTGWVFAGWEDLGYITPYSQVCEDYNVCPHHYGTGWYEWNNYYRYASNRCWYSKEYDGYYTPNGYYGNSGWVSTSTSYNPYNTYRRETRQHMYRLKRAYLKEAWEATYQKWDEEYRKRALMHSDPNATWRITAAYKRSINVGIVPLYNRVWNWIKSWVYGHSCIASKYVYSLSEPESVYRLTFPYSPISRVYNSYNNGTPTTSAIHTVDEDNFLKYVLGDGKIKQTVPIWFFQGDSGKLPNIIFRADCTTDTYTYKAGYWYTHSYRRWCRTYTETRWQTTIMTDMYIKVNMNTYRSECLSGITDTPYSNMSVTNTTKGKELWSDIPSNDLAKELISTPLSYMKEVSDANVTWGGIAIRRPENAIQGTGYTAALPWMNYRNDLESTVFENANNYLCMEKTIWNAKNKTLRDVMSSFRFLTLDPRIGVASRYSTIDTTGVAGYREIPDSRNARLMKDALLYLYTTSTFFKSNTHGDYRNPIISSNDNIMRSLNRIAVHQYSWLWQCKKMFVNDIDFKSVLSIIFNTVDTSILSRSYHRSPTYNPNNKNSVYYHYWIDQAIRIFENGGNKANVGKAFNKVASVLSNYIKSSKKLIDKDMTMWSYNQIVFSYNSMDYLMNYFDNNGSSIFLSATQNVNGSYANAIGDYMYAYLAVLYEYRKFFINKRCNKVDGTLWIMRALEGAIPSVTCKLDEMKNPNDPKGNGKNGGGPGNPQWNYKVDFYSVQNDNTAKIQAAAGFTDPLDMDRTKYIYVKVNYVDESIVKDYLEKCKMGKWDESTSGRYIYISQVQKWAELPFDGKYRYESTEFIQNEARKVYNKKAEKTGRPDLYKDVNANIEECIFDIHWSDGSGGLLDYSKKKGVKLSKFLNMDSEFPYVYKHPETEDYPSIVFNVMSGVDISKVADISNKFDKSQNALSAVCYIKEDSDYWQVRIPDDHMPKTVGYLTNLSISTLLSGETELAEPNIDFPGSATGAFGYMLYPIVEEQANSIPGVGVDLNGISEQLKQKCLTSKGLS